MAETKELPPIELKPVKSTSVTGYGYDESTQRLAVQFRAGGPAYHYSGVPPKVFAALEAADSKGKFIGSNVVKAFDHVKVPAAKK